MEKAIFKVVFVLGVVIQLFIRLRYLKVSRTAHIPRREHSIVDFIFVILSVSGFFIIPVIYVFTKWLDEFNYNLPLAVSIIFGLSYLFGILLFYKAHNDLGKYWWMGYELSYEKELVTDGIYAWIRHPMYAGLFLIGVGNIFILQNWIAGFTHIIVLVPIYFFHVPREERHLKEHFGDAYKYYKKYTGKIFPGRRKAGM